MLLPRTAILLLLLLFPGYKTNWLEHTGPAQPKPVADLDKLPHIPPRLPHEKPAQGRLRWIVGIAIRHALRALPALDTLQQACVEQAAAQALPKYKMTFFEGDHARTISCRGARCRLADIPVVNVTAAPAAALEDIYPLAVVSRGAVPPGP